jgi:uncharacterized membrane protein
VHSPTAVRSDQAGLERIVFFSDAVFAIVATLLVLPIAVDTEIGAEAFGATMSSLIPELVAFVVSFLVVGQFWMAHHRTFGLVRRYDGMLLLLNLLALMAISFLPFPTALLGARGSDDGAVVAFYAGCLTVASALAAVVWIHAVRAGLVEQAVSTETIRANTWRSLVSVAVFAVSVPLGLLGLLPALACWVIALPVARALVTRTPGPAATPSR